MQSTKVPIKLTGNQMKVFADCNFDYGLDNLKNVF